MLTQGKVRTTEQVTSGTTLKNWKEGLVKNNQCCKEMGGEGGLFCPFLGVGEWLTG